MPLERRRIESALTSKGFQGDRNKNDHRFFRLYVGAKRTEIFTKVSHGSGHREISDNLVAKMARQVKLTAGEFRSLVSCELSGPGYLEILQKRGIRF